MKLTRRGTLAALGGLATATAGCLDETEDGIEDNGEPEESEEEEQPEEIELELLAEETVDHDHACRHAEFDDRTPLEGDDLVVGETHVIWSVVHEKGGRLTFDADEHHHDGPFVFYTADGTVDVSDGEEVERDEVGPDDCEPLDEYVSVEPTDDGEIVLELRD